MQKYLAGFEGRDAVLVAVNHELTKSRGTITLKSSDPLEHPRIDPNYFGHPQDLQDMVDSKLKNKILDRSSIIELYYSM
jgi:choline dehydrogenase-like flavoprotein